MLSEDFHPKQCPEEIPPGSVSGPGSQLLKQNSRVSISSQVTCIVFYLMAAVLLISLFPKLVFNKCMFTERKWVNLLQELQGLSLFSFLFE